MTINKKRLSQIRKIQKNSHKRKRFSQIITNKNKCEKYILHRRVDMSAPHSFVVLYLRVLRQFQASFL